jgi:predicted nucleic acid-binding protein
MLLLDTNVLVALVDERDGLHARARRDLKRLKGPFGATSATLCEACFLLPASYLRERLRFILNRLPVHLLGSNRRCETKSSAG